MIDANDFTGVKKKSTETTGTNGIATGKRMGSRQVLRCIFTVATNPDKGTTHFNVYAVMKDLVIEVLATDNGTMVIRN
jgi:hypothetical protein